MTLLIWITAHALREHQDNQEGVTAEKKAALIKGAPQLLVDVLGKNPPPLWRSSTRWKLTAGESAVKR